MVMKTLTVCLFAFLVSAKASAAALSYDLGGSTGSVNQYSYSELHLGLNWFVIDWLNWRNAVFTRFGTNVESVTGLDSSLLATYSVATDGGGLGFQIFAGPGVRIASGNNNAATAEAGLVLQLGGLQVGGGARYLSYTDSRKDHFGVPLPKDETQLFLILGGGGSF